MCERGALGAALLVIALPAQGWAEGRYATVETSRIAQEAQVVTSLAVGPEAAVDADGFIMFSGQVVASDGRAAPMTVIIDTAGLPEAPPISVAAEQLGLSDVTEFPTFDAGLLDVTVLKTIYTMRDVETEAYGTMVITDEPIPVIVGWLAVAGLASFAGLTVYGISECTERFALSMKADWGNSAASLEVECVRATPE
ncbi:MAG: hypothetical protein ACK46Q_14090 [Hyphomonas sp.]